MAKKSPLPEEFQKYVEPYYVDPFGEMPPIPKDRLETGAVLAPDLNLAAEEARKSALFSDVFDEKTAQLFVVAIMAGSGSAGLPWHVRAARRYGATWDELYKVVEIASFFKGFGALQDGGRAIGQLWQEEVNAEE